MAHLAIARPSLSRAAIAAEERGPRAIIVPLLPLLPPPPPLPIAAAGRFWPAVGGGRDVTGGGGSDVTGMVPCGRVAVAAPVVVAVVAVVAG